MKDFIFAVALFAALPLCAQEIVVAHDFDPLPVSERTHLVTVSGMYGCPGLTREQISRSVLQALALEGYAATYADDNKIIAHLARQFTYGGGAQEVCFVFVADIQDGRVRLSADHIRSERVPNVSSTGWGYAEEWVENRSNGVKMPNERERFRLQSFAADAIDCIKQLQETIALYIVQPTEQW